MRGKWDLVFRSHESKGIGCKGGGGNVGIARGFEGSGCAIPTSLPQNGVARGAEPRPGPGREHGDCPKVADRTPPQNPRNKPIFHFDGAPFSKTGELRPPDPSLQFFGGKD